MVWYKFEVVVGKTRIPFKGCSPRIVSFEKEPTPLQVQALGVEMLRDLDTLLYNVTLEPREWESFTTDERSLGEEFGSQDA